MGAGMCTRQEYVCECGSDTWAHLADYADPLAPATLLKACLVALNWVCGASDWLLEGGVEIYAWSCLPQGSGLGTSSILMAAVLQSLAMLLRRRYDTVALTHLVLLVEQLLTSGGGWQDQVGGILPGFKLSYSPGPRCPLPPQWKERSCRSLGNFEALATDATVSAQSVALNVWPVVLEVQITSITV
jgi:hypothetical protein